jgi:hypothetical protein
MSPNTIRNYRTTFAKLKAFFPANPAFEAITRDQLIDFFAWLRDEYLSEPDGAAPRGQIKLRTQDHPERVYRPARAVDLGLGRGLRAGQPRADD